MDAVQLSLPYCPIRAVAARKDGEAVEYLADMEVKATAELPTITQPVLPTTLEKVEFLSTSLPTFEKDILDIERMIERRYRGVSVFVQPGSMMRSELVKNKQLIDGQPCISAGKNAIGTGYFMMQTARNISGAMK